MNDFFKNVACWLLASNFWLNLNSWERWRFNVIHVTFSVEIECVKYTNLVGGFFLHNQLIDWFVWLINQLIVLAWRVNTATATIASADMDMGYQATMLAVAEISYNTNQPDLDKSLELEKFPKRNYSWFSLLSWRNEFSCLVLLSIFKIFRKHFSFSSRFTRFLFSTSLSPLDFQKFV